jgi:dihydroorotate dehydrogenase
MPDWSYGPLMRPLLFRLPTERGRDLTLWAVGTLGKLPLGPVIIEAFGHMRLAPELKRVALGTAFAGPVGLGAGLDAHAAALRGLARFGVGIWRLVLSHKRPSHRPPGSSGGQIRRPSGIQPSQ